MAVPTVDFSKFSASSDLEAKEAAYQLVQSLRKHGFVKLVNHGIPREVTQAFFTQAEALFNLPIGAKLKICNPKGALPQRGWSCVGAEQLAKVHKANFTGENIEALQDVKESFDAGPAGDVQYPNRWPSQDIPGFQTFVEDAYNRCQRLSLQIIRAIESGAGLPEGILENRCSEAASEFRMNYYPSTELSRFASGKVKRTWAHTDFGIITLLWQDQTGGLEIEDRSSPGKFFPVVTESEDEVIVNTSDTLQRWSNDEFTAGVHQVVLPPQMHNLHGDVPVRYSTAFFFKASRGTSVGPLSEFVSEEKPPLYEEMTAMQFHNRRTAMLY